MKKIDKQQTNKDKQYYFPMEVTDDTIKDYEISLDNVVWTKIGNRKIRAVMIPVTREQYYEFMRPLWREDKRKQRSEPMVSLDKLYENTEYEVSDDSSLEEILMKKLLVEELHRALDELDEIDRTIMDIFSHGGTESEIGKTICMSQRGVNKRKHRIFAKLKDRLKDFR